MNESKFLNNKKNNPSNLKKYIYSFLSKTLISALILISLLIIVKKDSSLKNKINEKVFNTNFSFASINKWYKNTFGEILPFDKLVIDDEVEVFNEKLKYKEESLYKDGVKLTVNTNYLVPVMKSGIVVFMGEKENYGYTVIVQQVDSVDVWYGNINVNDKIKMYDYVEEGSLLGESVSDYIYLAFQKEGKFLDYKEYL